MCEEGTDWDYSESCLDEGCYWPESSKRRAGIGQNIVKRMAGIGQNE